MYRADFLLFLVIFTLLLFPFSGAAQTQAEAQISADSLFDLMEKRTETIDAIQARVELSNKDASKLVTLSIKNPDKFAIEFDDDSVMVFFNGKNLWIYVKVINEVFYYFSEAEGFISSYLGWFSPKKIFTSLTRSTLFSFFDITMIESDKTAAEELHHLRFVPKMRSVFKTLFEVGHYQMQFSAKSCLPTEVVEYDEKAQERGRLKVVEYRLNEHLPDSYFNYEPPITAAMVPISVVIAQKIEKSTASFIDHLKKTADKLSESIWNWSF